MVNAEPGGIGRRPAKLDGGRHPLWSRSPRRVFVQFLKRMLPWLSSADRLPLLVLVVLPVLVFAVPAALGHPVWPGDDLNQNEPLRALVGADIRQARLPIFDPYIWSGAPLLGGWNAGAAYPFTWLFAVLPATIAWVGNQISVFWVSTIATYVFCRANRLSPISSFLGAFVATFAGAEVGQIPHFGLVAGVSWIPCQLLCVLGLVRSKDWSRRWLCCAGLAVAASMTVLAGEPRAIDDAIVVTGIYSLWSIAKMERPRLVGAAMIGLGALTGAALGAVQILPGIRAVATSQRSQLTFNLFNGGSYSLKWLSLLLVPNALGGSGSFGSPQFLASYNLTEVTGYVGLLAVVAVVSLGVRGLAQGARAGWLVWLVVAIVGLVLALGGSTPAWHLLIRIPFFNGQRLQSRNISIFDFGAAMALAYWAEAWLSDGGRLVPADSKKGLRFAAWVAAFSVIGGAVLVAGWGLVDGTGELRWLGVPAAEAAGGGRLRFWMLPSLFLAGLLAWLVIRGKRLRPGYRGRCLAAIVIADVTAFVLTSVLAVAPHLDVAAAPSLPSTSPVAAGGEGLTSSLASLVGQGRVAIYDPDLLDGPGLLKLGSPDQNVISGLASVQGYSSIVDGTYAGVTGAHQAMGAGQDVLSPTALEEGIFDQLDTTVLATVPGYVAVIDDSPVDTSLPFVPGADPASGIRSLSTGHAEWTLGSMLALRTVDLSPASASDGLAPTQPEPGGSSDPPPPTGQIGLVQVGGGIDWLGTPKLLSGPTPVTPSTDRDQDASPPVWEVQAGGVEAVGIVYEGPADPGLTIAPLEVTSESGDHWILDGQLQSALSSPRWSYLGQQGAFALYRDNMAGTPLSIAPIQDHPSAVATIKALSGPASAPTSAAIFSTAGARVLRSQDFIPGWVATWTPDGGRSLDLPVIRSGLIQSVTVPPGRGTLTWSYHGPGVAAGAVISALGLVADGSMLVAGLRLRTRRRHASRSK